MYQVAVSVFCLKTVNTRCSLKQHVCMCACGTARDLCFLDWQRQQVWKSVGYTAGSPLAVPASMQHACKPTCI